MIESLILGLFFLLFGFYFKKLYFLFSLNLFSWLKKESELEKEFIWGRTRIALYIVGALLILISCITLIYSPLKKWASIISLFLLLALSCYLIFLWLIKPLFHEKNKTIIYIVCISSFIIIGVAGRSFFQMKSYTNENLSYIVKNQLYINNGYPNDTIKITLNSIDSIKLKVDIPIIKKRTNGVSISDIRKGYYILADNKSYFININSIDQPPFIYIYRKHDLPIIMNCKESGHTEKLFTDINNGIKTIK